MMDIDPTQLLFPSRPRLGIRSKEDDMESEAATEMSRKQKACDRILEAID